MTWRSLWPLPPQTWMSLRSRSRSDTFRLVASDTRRPTPYIVARIARWPRFFGASSRALTSSFVRMTGSFFSYRATESCRSRSCGSVYSGKRTETADGLNISGKLDPLLIEQVQLPRADLFGAELVGRLVEVSGELRDRANIAFHGRGENSCECGDPPAFAFSVLSSAKPPSPMATSKTGIAGRSKLSARNRTTRNCEDDAHTTAARGLVQRPLSCVIEARPGRRAQAKSHNRNKT
jgi:hypothetical protein